MSTEAVVTPEQIREAFAAGERDRQAILNPRAPAPAAERSGHDATVDPQTFQERSQANHIKMLEVELDGSERDLAAAKTEVERLKREVQREKDRRVEYRQKNHALNTRCQALTKDLENEYRNGPTAHEWKVSKRRLSIATELLEYVRDQYDNEDELTFDTLERIAAFLTTAPNEVKP